MAPKRLHVVMLPWLAFGHILPYLDLAKLIAQKGHKVSFLSAPRNIDRLPKLPLEFHSSISFVRIPFPDSIPGLPENAEATIDIHDAAQMVLLKKAFDSLESGVVRFLEDSPPDWFIHDFAPHWLPPVTARLGVSSAFFLINSAWFLAFFRSAEDQLSGSDYRTRAEDFMVPPRWVKFNTKLGYRRYEANWIVGTERDAESGYSDFYRVGKVIMGCDAILVRHCYEFEPDWLGLLEELNHRRVVPVGLLPPKVEDHNSANDGNGEWISVRKWLDAKEKGSVVYVAFGTETALSGDQLSELAHGLELSGVPFFWVLRKPHGCVESESDGLPSGFEERVSGRGIVWKSWAPQLKILSHESVGGFLTHCGCSAIVEALAYGHPMIALPLLPDPGLNSRIMVEQGFAVEVPRNEEDGSYTREWVADSVKLVMIEDEGRGLRERAQELRKIFADRELHAKYIDKLVEYLEEHRRTKKVLEAQGGNSV